MLRFPLAFRPRLAEPPREADVAVIGAGAAGIAAARRCLGAGLSVAVAEARGRVGGRAVTVLVRGHAVDLGAHWLHGGPRNPLVRLGLEGGELLRRAPLGPHIVVEGRIGGAADRRSYGRAFARADRTLDAAASKGADRSLGEALPLLGPWRAAVAATQTLLGGRPLAEVSLHDHASLAYADNAFIVGGYGAFLARLAAGLPVRLNAAAERLRWSGSAVAIETEAGLLRARAAIVTVPVSLLGQGMLRFEPDLPPTHAAALAALLPGTYEHVLLHWPSAPFRGRDRLAKLIGRGPPVGLMTRLDGTAFHYLALDHATVAALAQGGPDAPARFARSVLIAQFGPRALRDLAVVAATRWHAEPWSQGSWAVAPPGAHPARAVLKQAVGGRVWLAGEALSEAQWCTVGGAWAEGDRAASAVIRALRP